MSNHGPIGVCGSNYNGEPDGEPDARGGGQLQKFLPGCVGWVSATYPFWSMPKTMKIDL